MNLKELHRATLALILGAYELGIDDAASVSMQARVEADRAGKSREEGYHEAIAKLSALILDRTA